MNKREYVETLVPLADPEWWRCPLDGWEGDTPLRHFEEAHRR